MKSFLVFLSSLTFLISAPVFAYIPPSQFIVKGWINKHGGMKAVKMQSTVTGFSSDLPTATHFRVTTVYDAKTQKLKSWAVDDLDRVLYSLERNFSSLSPVSKLLFFSEAGEVFKVLHENGVPVRTESELLKLRTEVERRESEQESLVRWNGGLAWVLGIANSKQEPESPQLWFDKDLFLPVRFLYHAATVGDLYDFRLENYKFMFEFPYPRTISLYKKGAGKIFTEQMVDIALNMDVKPTPRILGNGFTESGHNASIELKSLIQNYYDSVR